MTCRCAPSGAGGLGPPGRSADPPRNPRGTGQSPRHSQHRRPCRRAAPACPRTTRTRRRRRPRLPLQDNYPRRCPRCGRLDPLRLRTASPETVRLGTSNSRQLITRLCQSLPPSICRDQKNAHAMTRQNDKFVNSVTLHEIPRFFFVPGRAPANRASTRVCLVDVAARPRRRPALPDRPRPRRRRLPGRRPRSQPRRPRYAAGPRLRSPALDTTNTRQLITRSHQYQEPSPTPRSPPRGGPERQSAAESFDHGFGPCR